MKSNIVNDMAREQTEDNIFAFEIPDDIVETAALSKNGQVNNFTQWMCTALFFCPGP